MQEKRMKAWAIAIMVLLAGCSAPASNTIDGIQCQSMEGAAMHIHAHLDLFVNNRSIPVPSNVGILKSCLFWLHTHDGSGIIHIEAPTKREFTLGNFFSVWDRTFGSNTIGNQTPIVYVNGQLYEGDYRSVKLNKHDSIVLEIDSTIPPKNYMFPPGL